MTDDWLRLIAWLAGHPQTRVVVVSGAGRAFCAGSDVKGLAGIDAAAATELSHRQARMWLAHRATAAGLRRPGQRPGAGGRLRGGVFVRLSDRRIHRHVRHARGAARLDAGLRAAQLDGLDRQSAALDLCLTGRTITAQQALEYGLAHRVAPPNQLARATDELVQQLLATPPAALRATKQVLHLDEGTQAKAAYLNDTAAYIHCLETPDAREGIKAFAEKRRAKFQGP